MGTRGIWGFVHEGKEYLTYNHFDSYPSGLGQNIAQYLNSVDVEFLRSRVRELRLVNEAGPGPTPDEVERLACFADRGVQDGDLRKKWYVLLRHTQGDPEATLRAGVMIDGASFAGESIFCEWGYVIDLDEELFEVYEGFRKKPPTEGRFGGRYAPEEGAFSRETYYAIQRVAAFGLARRIPDMRGWEYGFAAGKEAAEEQAREQEEE